MEKVLEFLTGLNNKVEIDINLDFPNDKIEVHLPPELHEKFKPIAVQIASQIGLDGIRLYRDLGIMLKAIALKHGRTEVIMEDVETLLQHVDYINYEFKFI